MQILGMHSLLSASLEFMVGLASLVVTRSENGSMVIIAALKNNAR